MSPNYLEEYYNRYDEEGRLLRKHQRIEFLTTTRYVDKYIQKGNRILEVGAGTGRYSMHYADQGYRVDSVELVQHNINQFEKKIKKEHQVSLVQGNALDLCMYQENTFDVTLVLGPMYHMYTDEDKQQVVREALRVTKPNGVVFLAYITHDAVMVHFGLLGRNLLYAKENKMFTSNYECISTPKDVFSMFHVHQFNALLDQFPVEHLHTVATDGVAPLFEEVFNKMNDDEFDEWLNYHFTTCEKEDLMGYSSHVLYIGRKIQRQ